MKRLLILGLLVCNFSVAQNLGETASVYDNACEVLFLKEAARLRHDLASIREQWRLDAKSAFDKQALTPKQRLSADKLFATSMIKLGDDLVKTTGMSGMLEAIAALPAVDAHACADEKALRQAGDASVAAYKAGLDKMLDSIAPTAAVARATEK
jgi:hypothetical protein